jgi:hypothetical protein
MPLVALRILRKTSPQQECPNGPAKYRHKSRPAASLGKPRVREIRPEKGPKPPKSGAKRPKKDPKPTKNPQKHGKNPGQRRQNQPEKWQKQAKTGSEKGPNPARKVAKTGQPNQE